MKRSTGSLSQSAPSSSSTSERGGSHSLFSSIPVRVGCTLGLLALACLVVLALLYQLRRRRRRKRLFGSPAENGREARRGPSRPYGSREKGGVGLMEDTVAPESTSPSDLNEKSGMIGLGMGAIGATLASISSRFASRQTPDEPYVALDDTPEAGGPLRKSTRRIGTGIRLVGPRSPPPKGEAYKPVRFASNSRFASRNLRLDILFDEDSRKFARLPVKDWVLPSDESEGQWRPAHRLLDSPRQARNERDRSEDTDSALVPAIGGPVPTPRESRSDLDTFEESESRHDSFGEGIRPRLGQDQLPPFSPSDHSDLTSLLAPPLAARRSSANSLPRSQRSFKTTSFSDVEEGIIQHARIVSQQSASVISPLQSSYEPIKRSESFFRRMTSGAISSLLTRQATDTRRAPDIRDPAPLPTLWQIASLDEPRLAHRSSFLDADALRPPPQHSLRSGPSLSSLQSAKSMRDMVIMQRESTSLSIETETVIETVSPLLNEPDRPHSTGHHRHGLSIGTTIGSETPGSIVFNGADFASPMVFPEVDFGPARATKPPTFTDETSASPPLDQSEQVLMTPTKSNPVPPVDSPVPTPLLSHRRPVRDVVDSINKRGNATPLSLFSPTSQYSPGSVSPQITGSSRGGPVGRPSSTLYEAVKRSTLTVANPDGQGSIE